MVMGEPSNPASPPRARDSSSEVAALSGSGANRVRERGAAGFASARIRVNRDHANRVRERGAAGFA